MDTLQTIIDEKDSDLQDQLDTLQSNYDAVYNPLKVDFILEDLDISLMVTTDTYSDNTAITGTVFIPHTNGAPFTGSFKLSLTKVYVNAGTSNEFYDIPGAEIYNWNSPFVLGAGSYKLTLSEIKDSLGSTVLTSNQLKPYVIYIFEG